LQNKTKRATNFFFGNFLATNKNIS